ncbi:MAG: hypothetical protein JSR25_05395 [Proteobacteria bacterium]|nr:hypothetical protein [Pseudomonadota bacterium]
MSDEQAKSSLPANGSYFLDTFGVAIAGTYYLIRSFTRMMALGNGDLRKVIVFRAIWASNVRRLAASQANARFDSRSTPPPLDMFQPISGLAVAEAMRMPYESVRRKINALKREGLCIVTPQSGLVVDVSAIDRHPARDMIERHCLHSIDLLAADLHHLGFDFSRLPQPEETAAITSRGIMRISAELDLQLFDVFAQLDGCDLVEWFVILSIWDVNVGRYYEARRDDPEMEAAPDAERTPISVRKLSSILGMPLETTRRHVNTLLDRKVLTRPDARGVIVSSSLWKDAQHRSAHRRICIIIARAMSELARQGVPLKRERPSSAGWHKSSGTPANGDPN